MASDQPTPPVPSAGLPPGVEAGPLGRRFVAALLDWLVPAVLAAVSGLVPGLKLGLGGVVISLVAGVLILAWGLLVWWMFATRAAGPGMRLMRLQLVGLADGRPVGAWRYLLRTLIFVGLALTGIGLLLMLVFMTQHPRRQGWHDRAVNAVGIKARALAPPRPKSVPAQVAAPADGGPSQLSAKVSAASDGTAAEQPQPLPPPSIATGPPPLPYPPANPYPPPGPPASPYPPPGYQGPPVPLSPPPGYQGPPVPLTPPPGYQGPPVPLTPPPGYQGPPVPLTPPPGYQGPPVPLTQPSPAPVPPAPGPQSQAPATQASPTGVGVAAPVAGPVEDTWSAVLDDGREIPISGVVLLGRNPQPRPGEEDAQLIKVDDPSRTVSKSHLELGVNAGGMYVLDRGSTNGSTVTNANGLSKRCPPGDVVMVSEGNIVSFGDHWLEVRRG